MTRAQLREKANALPLEPGVYLMMDKAGKVIYVGKAKKLRNRVSQYFQETSSHTEKTRAMVALVDHFDTIFVKSEFEALVLENSLIKRHMPRYNILLKDDKGYPFVRLSDEPYPRFSLTNRIAQDGARYFGPFGGRHETRQAIDAVCAALKLPTCRRRFPRDLDADRPCLNYHMGRCDGFCRSTMSAEEYRRRMEQAAEALQFERAAALRDQAAAIGALGKRQTVIAGICADTDIWGVARGAGKSCCAVLHVEDGQLTGRETELIRPTTWRTRARSWRPSPPSTTCPGPSCRERSWSRRTPATVKSSARPSPAGRGTGCGYTCPSGGRRRSCWPWPAATRRRRWSGPPPRPSGPTTPSPSSRP